eukprot:CAMPEP_0203944178 /NCGR_PEP_ID=MMETSP0359-20131031/79987_1 /ASSEMBLY_ACC=CAM_ASM_000338 /TAXON_ID=268821 /ORGANISM="Scrippsiella Hangoei, Strain SHTV-5" /LENGTH=77 /DNA_ID=CAMNT_0050875151 /DNA_START=15 /DNA_END=245 /DNA_ORIENTATION=+
MVVWETEKVTKDYPTQRQSGYGRFVKVEKTTVEFDINLTREHKSFGIIAEEDPVQVDGKSEMAFIISDITAAGLVPD